MTVVNIFLLNALWFSCVLGAANDLLWPGVFVLLLILGINIHQKTWIKIDYTIILISIVAGLVIDGVLQALGIVNYAFNVFNLGFLPPLWIMMLWVGFGATVRTGMHWLLNKPKMGALVMLIGAPLSYLSATQLGATQIPVLWQAMTLIGFSWLAYFSLIVYLVKPVEQKLDVVA